MVQPKDPSALNARRQSAPARSQSQSVSDGASPKSPSTSSRSSKAPRPVIFDKYKCVKLIGKGQFGEVFAVKAREGTAAHKPDSGKAKDNLFACKIIQLSDSSNPAEDETLLKDVLQEVRMMLDCKHPNVQDLVDVSVENNRVYIVSSLCRGGDLAQALQLRGCLCEEDAKAVMTGIFSGLSYLHSRGIVHRDIKLENVLLSKSSHDMSNVKIIDMGFAKKLSGSIATHGEALNTVCGTPLYIAPELVRPTLESGRRRCKARFGTQADMWSCGVILYSLLSGCLPFHTDGKRSMIELFEDIESASYDFSDPVWSIVSDDALSLIEGLLEIDPSKRLTAEEALRHPWMVSC